MKTFTVPMLPLSFSIVTLSVFLTFPVHQISFFVPFKFLSQIRLYNQSEATFKFLQVLYFPTYAIYSILAEFLLHYPTKCFVFVGFDFSLPQVVYIFICLQMGRTVSILSSVSTEFYLEDVD